MRKDLIMKIYSTKLLVLLVVILEISVSAQTSLESLYQSKRCFDLRDEVMKRGSEKTPEMLFYRGAVANLFNENEKSIGFLRKYLKSGELKNDLRK